MKRDGNTVLGSLWADLLYNEASTSRAGGILPQIDVMPKLAKQLADNPEQVIADLQEIRRYGTLQFISPMPSADHVIATDPSGVRFSVTGNVLKLDKPRSTWAKYFDSALPVCLFWGATSYHDFISFLGNRTCASAAGF
jgi:hypothetical protein